MDDFKVVIPARYGSTRLPGKPLLALAGRSMIEHVYRRAVASGAQQVLVATDDARIRDAVEQFGGSARMTSGRHHSGSDRIAEVIEGEGWDGDTIVVNLQGDEPCMPAAAIAQVAAELAAAGSAAAATLCTPIEQRDELFDPHVVKVVMDHNGDALYFSRAPIPWHRDEFMQGDRTALPDGVGFFRHLGIYAYRAQALREFVAAAPAPIERAESLEQLRLLWSGRRIRVAVACERPGPGVDTRDDLRRVERLLREDATATGG